ncbi:MAG: hypothetical protein WBM54_12760 [Woeseia sp.]
MKILAYAVAAGLAVCGVLSISQLNRAEADSTKVAAPRVVAGSDIDAGRYIVTIGSCDDCHTPNWAETGGNVTEAERLIGSPIGWRGPWGTTYASNLRLFVQDMNEDAFVEMLATRNARPPMPWMNMNKLTADDARNVYRYIRSLGPKGERMPLAAAPGVEPATPFYSLDPQPPRSLSASQQVPAQ